MNRWLHTLGMPQDLQIPVNTRHGRNSNRSLPAGDWYRQEILCVGKYSRRFLDACSSFRLPGCAQAGAKRLHALSEIADKAGSGLCPFPMLVTSMKTLWTIVVNAASVEDPRRLVRTLSDGIVRCRGVVLSHGVGSDGILNMIFEFQRSACFEIYGVLMSAGVELGPNGHQRLTELCQCTLSNHSRCGVDIATVDLEVQTFLNDGVHSSDEIRLV